MSLQMVRFRADENTIDELQVQFDRVFAALAQAAPQGFNYSAYRHTDEPEFVLVMELADGADNPLLKLPEARELRDLIARAASGPVPPEPFELVGAYTS